MGFKIIRALLIDALQSDRFRAEPREDIRTKNLLWAGQIDAAFVIRLLLRCDGTRYRTSEHHQLEDVECHIFTPEMEGEQWYIKAYLLPERAVFISVHR